MSTIYLPTREGMVKIEGPNHVRVDGVSARVHNYNRGRSLHARSVEWMASAEGRRAGVVECRLFGSCGYGDPIDSMTTEDALEAERWIVRQLGHTPR